MSMSGDAGGDDLPPMRIDVCDPARREPGLIVFTARPGSIRNQKAQLGWVIALDRAGAVRFNLKVDAATQDVRRDLDGNIMYSQAGIGLITRIDWQGKILGRWHAQGRWLDKTPPAGSIALPIDVLHHAFQLLPNGNFLVLSAEARSFDGWHGSTTDASAPRATANLVGDVVAEFTRTGDLVREWRLLDMLDPYRIGHGSRSNYWHKLGFPGAFDWSHTNSIFYDKSDDSILASLRHQDCIIKFARATGELRWILGNHSHWTGGQAERLLTPGAGAEWQFHQHDCSVVGPGRVLCFDNGNFRAGAFAPKQSDATSYSRVVEFEVDEAARTVRQPWCFGDGGENRIFACYQGGACRLPKTGNTFMTFGGICTIDGVPTSDNVDAFGRARLIEVTSGGDIVFDAWIDDSGSAEPRPFSAFRAEHFPDG
jgi:arylsulfate sulfotransferase